jgi:hypothetical protein
MCVFLVLTIFVFLYYIYVKGFFIIIFKSIDSVS